MPNKYGDQYVTKVWLDRIDKGKDGRDINVYKKVRISKKSVITKE